MDRVEGALVDPAFLAELAGLPKLGRPELVDQQIDGTRVRQRVRYHFTGSLSPAVTAVIDPTLLVWVEAIDYDLTTHEAQFQMLPDHYANRLRCSGTYRFQSSPTGARRIIDGDLKVSFPLVGGKVERAIVSGLEDHLTDEAELLEGWLARSGQTGP